MPSYKRQPPETLAPSRSSACATTTLPGYGNAARQERLREETVDPGGECDGDDLADAMARDAFLASSFSERDFQPSTGFGRFDAAYEPTSGVLDIVLRLAFDFTLPEGASYADRAVAAWTGDTGWDAAERDDFIKQYKQVVESTWSGAHAVRCVRPGWEQIVAVPRLRIELVDPKDAPHYVVTVHGASDDPMAMDTQRPLVGEAGLFGGPGHAEMDQDDVASRPISVRVKAEEAARLEALLPKPGVRVIDDGAAARLPPSELGLLRKVADGLDRSAQYPSGPQLALEPVGWASEPGAFEASLRGATAVGEALADLAPGRSEAPVGWGDTEPGVVSLRISEASLQASRQPDFSFAAHETGHMLGLEDEYAGANHGRDGEASAAPLERAAGVEAPRRDVATSSVLAQGKDVLPAHYVTFWEVLTRMTSGYLAPGDWRIGR